MALMQSEMPEQEIWLCGDVNFHAQNTTHVQTCMHRTQHLLEHMHTFMQTHISAFEKFYKENKSFVDDLGKEYVPGRGCSRVEGGEGFIRGS